MKWLLVSERLERLERERHRLERERDRKYREHQERAAREETEKQRQMELEKRLREEAERRSVVAGFGSVGQVSRSHHVALLSCHVQFKDSRASSCDLINHKSMVIPCQ